MNYILPGYFCVIYDFTVRKIQLLPIGFKTMDSRHKIHIPHSDEELIQQCDVQTFRSGGKGGQHVNKTESGVRIVHRPTGIVVVCRRERSQHINRKHCLFRLRKKLQEMNREEKPRIPTRVPTSSVRKRREQKEATGKKKKLRKKIFPEE
ncbi:peptide chain release factor 2 [Chitinispirillum alkaliphilum]|nr:peptide chain release factor 2 [Chitinispirillum alkaliphilum]